MKRARSRSPRDTRAGLNVYTGKPLSPKYFKILSERRQLPICKKLSKVKKSFLKNQVTIIQGETGSGKTTQVP
jgi:pre-mRNA-splicing factor ATP-dependent RNA helicase DHX15/PRP43